jgi:hypothetical protein
MRRVILQACLAAPLIVLPATGTGPEAIPDAVIPPTADGDWEWEWSAKSNTMHSRPASQGRPDVRIGGGRLDSRSALLFGVWFRNHVGLWGELESGAGGYAACFNVEGQPDWVDFVREDWRGGMVTRKGIWKLGGSRLLICTAPPGEPRPTGFAEFRRDTKGETDCFRRIR